MNIQKSVTKGQKRAYWISTSLFSAYMFLSAVFPLVSSDAMAMANEYVIRWGFPQFFHLEWEYAKILGAIAVILPMVPKRLKEFAYSGFIILLISAIITHVIHKDPISLAAPSVICLIILSVSYRYYFILTEEKK